MMNELIEKRNHVVESHDCCGSSGKLQTGSAENSVPIEDHENNDTVSFLIDGMTCTACVNKIEAALRKQTGVCRVFVDLASGSATIHYDSDTVIPENLKSVIASIGYTAVESRPDVENNINKPNDRLPTQKIGPYPFLIGIAAALGVVGFYVGLQTLISDWYSAKMQFVEYRWWILTLSLGLGIQVTLFSFMRKIISGRNIKAAKSGLAASGGMSTASMAACCAHYLVPLLPALGLPFLSGAVAGIASYQKELLMLGVLSNLIGLGIMIRIMQKNGILNLKHKFPILNLQPHR